MKNQNSTNKTKSQIVFEVFFKQIKTGFVFFFLGIVLSKIVFGIFSPENVGKYIGETIMLGIYLSMLYLATYISFKSITLEKISKLIDDTSEVKQDPKDDEKNLTSGKLQI